MRNVRLLALAAVLALLTGIVIGHLTAPSARADSAVAYLTVKHCNGATNVAVSDGYTVQWRTKDAFGNAGSWHDATNTGTSDASCTQGTWRWKYSTGVAIDSTLYPQVEWQVTVAYGRSGTQCGGGSVTNHDGTTLNNLTYPGGTASITVGSYY